MALRTCKGLVSGGHRVSAVLRDVRGDPSGCLHLSFVALWRSTAEDIVSPAARVVLDNDVVHVCRRHLECRFVVGILEIVEGCERGQAIFKSLLVV